MVSFSGLAGSAGRLGSRFASAATNVVQAFGASTARMFGKGAASAADSLDDIAAAGSNAIVKRPKLDPGNVMLVDPKTSTRYFNAGKYGGGEWLNQVDGVVDSGIRRAPGGQRGFMSDYRIDFDDMTSLKPKQPLSGHSAAAAFPGTASYRGRMLELVPEFDDDVLQTAARRPVITAFDIDKPLPDIPPGVVRRNPNPSTFDTGKPLPKTPLSKPLPETPYRDVIGELKIRNNTATTQVAPPTTSRPPRTNSTRVLTGDPDEYFVVPPSRRSSLSNQASTAASTRALAGDSGEYFAVPPSRRSTMSLDSDATITQARVDAMRRQRLLGYSGDSLADADSLPPSRSSFSNYSDSNLSSSKRSLDDGSLGSINNKKPRSWKPGKMAAGIGGIAAAGMQIYNTVKGAVDNGNDDEKPINNTVIVNNSPSFSQAPDKPADPPAPPPSQPPVQPRATNNDEPVRVPTLDRDNDGIPDELDTVIQQDVF